MRKPHALSVLAAFLLAACAGAPATPSATVDLEARVSALEEQLAELSAASDEHGAAVSEPEFQIAVAQYVMDAAGFHAMDESLNATQTVDPAYLGTVNRVRKVVVAVPWPEDLHEQSGSFVTLLEEFAAALEADNGPEAAALATELHEVQHDFSHAIDAWLGEGDGHGD